MSTTVILATGACGGGSEPGFVIPFPALRLRVPKSSDVLIYAIKRHLLLSPFGAQRSFRRSETQFLSFRRRETPCFCREPLQGGF